MITWYENTLLTAGTPQINLSFKGEREERESISQLHQNLNITYDFYEKIMSYMQMISFLYLEKTENNLARDIIVGDDD